ncbi:C40 family peptidase [Nocardiopsis sp. YSL2]|uniref:C40 family peptidase n=1 Tax=Nocardiopsis sp. YSL2 TaxID=2939492 RepID=UPI0026F4230B|nr:NlpC/P60 family protein [Nocardiopsis sp. YSL2]
MATSRTGAFDCSGLAMRTWEAAGVRLPQVTTDQVNVGTRVALDEVRPGDLLFPGTCRSIRAKPADSAYYSARFVAAGRPA